MSAVGSFAKNIFRSMLLLACLGCACSGATKVLGQDSDAAVAEPAPVQDPPAGGAEDAGKAEDTPGMDDLDKAFDLKINSKSTRDLDKVARLCEQAIEKGLTADGAEQARVLAKTAYYEHAQQLTARILPRGSKKPDPRWKPLRREALRRLDKAAEIDPEMASVYVLMAKLQQLPLGDREKGKAAINKAMSLIEGDEQLMSEALIVKVRLTDDILSDSVMEDVNEAIRLDPNNREARGLRSQLLMRAGKLEQAFEDLDAVLETAGSYDAYAAQADQLLKNPEFPKSDVLQKAALRYLEKAMEIKSAPDLLLAKAMVLQTMQKPDEALAAINQNLESNPENYNALMMRSTINAAQKRIDQAIEDLDAALGIKPGDPKVLLQRMALHQLNENYDLAIADCKRLNDISNGKNFGFQMTLAQLYLSNDEPSKAVGAIDKTLEQYDEGVWDNLSPVAGFEVTQRRLRALRMRGDCHLHSGDHQDAIDDYELGVDLTDDIADFKRALPRPDPPKFSDRVPENLRLQAMEQWEQVTEELDKEFVGDAGLLNNLAWVLATSTIDSVRNGERAIELATSAAEISDFKEAYILSTLASAYAEVGEFDKAKEWINKAIEVNRSEIETIKTNENIDETTRAAAIKEENEQLASLKKELASYEIEKPWRERQTSKKEGDAVPEDDASPEVHEAGTADEKGGKKNKEDAAEEEADDIDMEESNSEHADDDTE